MRFYPGIGIDLEYYGYTVSSYGTAQALRFRMCLVITNQLTIFPSMWLTMRQVLETLLMSLRLL